MMYDIGNMRSVRCTCGWYCEKVDKPLASYAEAGCPQCGTTQETIRYKDGTLVFHGKKYGKGRKTGK